MVRTTWSAAIPDLQLRERSFVRSECFSLPISYVPAKNGFELVNRDVELLHLVFQLRITTIDQLSALSGRSVRALWGRLHKLTERRYLASVARFMQRKVYAVGSRGVSALIEQGYASADLAERRLRHNERTEIGIRHSLFVADIHTRLLLLTRDT